MISFLQSFFYLNLVHEYINLDEYSEMYLQKKRMPDGHNFVEAEQVIYKNVTRKHSGTYICEGSNGPGQIVKDDIKIDVLRKYLRLKNISSAKINFTPRPNIYLPKIVGLDRYYSSHTGLAQDDL